MAVTRLTAERLTRSPTSASVTHRCDTCGERLLAPQDAILRALADAAPHENAKATSRVLEKELGRAKGGLFSDACYLTHLAGLCTTPFPCPASEHRLGADTGHCPICFQIIATEPVSPRHPTTQRFVKHTFTAAGVSEALRRFVASRS